ncbi:MAG: T9SS type A sorting domain-containing protein, partial [Bacteroidia bacterium]|nr:T9SS type A sorting domain-containing protein [Bacteroidia bacterium]
AALSWEAFSPLSIEKYRLYASSDGGTTWQLITETMASRHAEHVPSPDKRWYRVEGILPDGARLQSNVAELLPYEGAVSIRVQPNPASEWVSFALSGAEGSLTVEIWDAIGRRVALLSGESQVLWRIPAELPAGVYLWRAEGGGVQHTGRLHIQR